MKRFICDTCKKQKRVRNLKTYKHATHGAYMCKSCLKKGN